MIPLESSETPVRKALKVALFGDPGTGKTHLALTFPDPVVVDTEGGTDFYRQRPGFGPFRVLKTKDLTQVIALLDAVEQGQIACGTVVIDSVTVLYEVLREGAVHAAEQRLIRRGQDPSDYTLTPRDWGKIKARFQQLMTRLYNLPVHTVFTGWVRDVYEGEGDTLRRVGRTLDADKKALFQPDILLELAVAKGQHVAFVRKDRTGTWPVDTRLTDVSYAKTFAPLVEHFGHGETARIQTEDDAAHAVAASFDEGPGGMVRQALAAHGLDDDAGLLLAYRKLQRRVDSLDVLTLAEAKSLATSISKTPTDRLQAVVAQIAAELAEDGAAS